MNTCIHTHHIHAVLQHIQGCFYVRILPAAAGGDAFAHKLQREVDAVYGIQLDDDEFDALLERCNLVSQDGGEGTAEEDRSAKPMASQHLATFEWMGDLYGRLLSAVQYKRFPKGQPQLEHVCEGVWRVSMSSSSRDVPAWCRDSLVPFLQQKLQSYLEDMGEEPVAQVGRYDDASLKPSDVGQLVAVVEEPIAVPQCEPPVGHLTTASAHPTSLSSQECWGADGSAYYLTLGYIAGHPTMTSMSVQELRSRELQLPKAQKAPPCVKTFEIVGAMQLPGGGGWSITRQHVLAALWAYHSSANSVVEDVATAHNRARDTLVLAADPQQARSLHISRTKLTLQDVLELIGHIEFEGEESLGSWVTAAQAHAATTRKSEEKELVDSCPVGYEPLGTAEVAEFDWVAWEADNLASCAPTWAPLPSAAAASKEAAEAEAEAQPTCHTMLYKNAINGHLSVLQERITLLQELQPLAELPSTVAHESPLTSRVLTQLKNASVQQSDVAALQSLVAVLVSVVGLPPPQASGEGGENETDGVKSTQDDGDDRQRSLTKEYVLKHKDDLAELSASAAIEDVRTFIRSQGLCTVNSNQIGTDLVELGVKKTRKARGYVYGLQQQQKTTDVFGNALVLDYGKVAKLSQDLRAVPMIEPTKPIGPWNAGARFLKPVASIFKD